MSTGEQPRQLNKHLVKDLHRILAPYRPRHHWLIAAVLCAYALLFRIPLTSRCSWARGIARMVACFLVGNLAIDLRELDDYEQACQFAINSP
jgi:hypothetical protein